MTKLASHKQRGEMLTDSALITELAEVIPSIMKLRGTPGLNLAVARRGKVIWERGFGSADLAVHRPMRSDTVSPAGSISKLYTSTAIMQLVERGVLDLTTPAIEYLDEIPVTNPLGERSITILDLLTMKSGLATDFSGVSLACPPTLSEHLKTSYSNSMLAEYGGAIPRWSAKVGDRYQYSNLGIATLGQIVERTNPEGLTFPQYVHQHILTPLVMNSSAFPSGTNRSDVAGRGDVSTGYARFGSLCLRTPSLRPAAYPANGFFTTPGDHIRLLLALLGDGVLDGHAVLSANTVEEMLAPRSPIAYANGPSPLWTGLSVLVGNHGREDHFFGHSGAHFFGWWHESRAYPHIDFAIAVFTNKWEMLSWHDPSYQDTATLISEYAANWIIRHRGHTRTSTHATWPWRVSYVIGLIMAERLGGLLGVDDPLCPALLDVVAAEAERLAASCSGSWDRAGFLAGVTDMAEVPPKPSAISAFLASARSRVSADEIKLIALELGGERGISIPLSVWFHAADEFR